MRFDDIHGTDWTFASPDGTRHRVFAVEGYGATQANRQAAEQFAAEHPDWQRSVETF